MGCDIHMVVERRIGDKWVGWSVPEGCHLQHVADAEWDWASPVCRSRNYRRFAALAGVRGDGPKARGIPVDASETTQAHIDDWGEDGHSHSHMMLIDAATIFLDTEHQEIDPESFKAQFPGSYYFNVDELADKADQFRLVFWFDN